MKVERVETLGEESWGGVAAVDRGEGDDPTDWGRVALLAGGDMAALLLFAAIGRVSHGESLAPGALLSTAGPFMLGWLAAAPLTGAFSRDAQRGKVGPAALAALKTWALGIPAGLVVRTVSRGYVPDKAFIIVALAVNAVFLIGWRAGLAAATPEEEGAGGQLAKRKDRQGSPFEFLQLLTSLVKRW